MTGTTAAASPPAAGRPGRHFDFLDGAPGCLGKTLVPIAGRPDALPGRLLIEPGGTALLLDACRRARPEVTDRVLVSLWSRYLFLAVVPPVILTLLLARRSLPLHPTETGVVLDESGWPAAIALRGAGVPGAVAAGPDESLAPLFRTYLEPVVEGLAAGGGLAPRILWGNVAHYLDWVAGRLDGLGAPSLAGEFAAMLRRPVWSRGGRNPTWGLLRRVPGRAKPVRAVCCLLRQIPGGTTCGGCPFERRNDTIPRLAEGDNPSH